MIIRPYQKVNNIYIPSIKIHFLNSENFQFNFYEYGLLDTGGYISLMPYSLIFRLNIFSLKRKNKRRVKGISSREVIATPYLVNLSFDNLEFLNAIIYGLPDEELGNQIIIGRNLLDRFSVTFDGVEKRIIIN